MQDECKKRIARRERIKDLSNKAEGIYHYIGPQHMLFRLINAGNELASEINHAVAYFTSFAQNGTLYDDGAGGSRSVIDCIYRKVGLLMCDIDIIHAAAGAEIMPEPFESIDRCYGIEYAALLREAVINGSPPDYKGPQQNPYVVNMAKPSIAYDANSYRDAYDDDFFDNFTREEEARDRKIVFHCTKSDLDAIKRYAHIIEVKYTEEDIHHA